MHISFASVDDTTKPFKSATKRRKESKKNIEKEKKKKERNDRQGIE